MLLVQGSTNDFTKSGFQNNNLGSKHTKVNSMINQNSCQSESDFRLNLQSIKNKQSDKFKEELKESMAQGALRQSNNSNSIVNIESIESVAPVAIK